MLTTYVQVKTGSKSDLTINLNIIITRICKLNSASSRRMGFPKEHLSDHNCFVFTCMCS